MISLFLLLVTQILDIYYTNKVLSQNGKELNSVVRNWMSQGGAWMLGKSIVALASGLYLVSTPYIWIAVAAFTMVVLWDRSQVK